MKYFPKYLILTVLLTGLFLAPQQNAWAIFTLSVQPQRGVQSINFEQAKPGVFVRNEEVTISVTSTLASQYTLYQTIYQPLTNESGNTIPQDAFIVFSPSSSLGTLRTQLETPVAMGQVPVYTSNAAGDSDEFVLVYNIKVPENQPGGMYRTQITFIAQLVNSQGSTSQSQVTLDVRVEVRPTFSVTIQGAHGSRELDLGHISKERPAAEDILKVDIESNSGAYKISQQLSEPLTSAEGEVIDETDFQFTSSGGTSGELAGKSGPTPLTSSLTRLYASDTGAGDHLQIQYTTSPESSQKAGIYRGILSFKVETDSALSVPEIITVPAKVEIESIFYLDIDTTEVTKVNFGSLKAQGEKKEKKVNLTVHSNLNAPYQVTQIVSGKFANEKGDAMPPENFTYYGSQAQTGKLEALSPLPVTEGDSVVFTSDSKGTPEKFSLNYELKVPMSPKAGSYSTNVRYSITAL